MISVLPYPRGDRKYVTTTSGLFNPTTRPIFYFVEQWPYMPLIYFYTKRYPCLLDFSYFIYDFFSLNRICLDSSQKIFCCGHFKIFCRLLSEQLLMCMRDLKFDIAFISTALLSTNKLIFWLMLFWDWIAMFLPQYTCFHKQSRNKIFREDYFIGLTPCFSDWNFTKVKLRSSTV